MKKSEAALAAAFCICLFATLFQLPFSLHCQELREDTLRLHIVANSDTEADQAVKLLVRDELLAQSEELLLDANDLDSAVALAWRKAGEIECIARDVLLQNGFDYDVRVTVVDMYFEQRTYENITLPAGTYKALRVELGAAAGKNWWCVVYPSLCLPAASEDALSQYSEEELEVLLSGDDYVIKFKLEELLQQLFGAKE